MTLPQNVKDADPNPLATGPTKWRAEHCVTHHHGCDCREWEHACEVERLESRLDAANALLRECHCYFEARGVDSRTIGESLSLNEKIQSHLQGAGDEAASSPEFLCPCGSSLCNGKEDEA